MSEFDGYLASVVKGTFLSRREKARLVEEMQRHLEESTAMYQAKGYEESTGRAQAMESFGRAKEIRRQVIRETFGV
ncbi:permease prefix domain 1-containing protein [Alicyclobacillus acidoterrestris]|uniref:Permease prefix domain 1-containing protein n=1 Tax=Alicyclobacillus acidoterrestris (strain ATCC 49025 / DSM 3922 / CIP 106132 / NCIMB 13137 / GD3B) TaxID=1356854 RepID=T0DF86_ALIAG|nr:permease prefix domain 1-containing protein [Alicyclobacillus acidoterrestris]EPZ48286.1 hypothetical protein N007_00775 [Alicyclobacillus acidoterrestris ATCC 49025]UNO50401.1 permease prefix domain 1-containing protein [Alicyclobacillus acidoterrestris]